jgi:Tfp pilus assembly protein PilO
VIKLNDKKTRFLLSLGVATLVLGGGFGWLTYTDWSEVSRLDTEAEGFRDRIAKADVEIRKIAGLEDRVLTLRQDVQNYVTILPDDAEIHSFVDKLTEFATETGVSINKLDDTAARQRKVRGKGASAEAFERITYKLELSGTTHALIAFIDLFENQYDRFVRIPSFQIKAFEDRSSGRDEVDPLSIVRAHDVSMSIETYVYNPRTKAKGGEPVEIINEGPKLARLRAEGALSNSGRDLVLVRYDYEPDEMRRDPFVDPRILLPVNQRISEEDRRNQSKILEDLSARIEALKASIDKNEQVLSIVERLKLLEADDKVLSALQHEVTQVEEGKVLTIREVAQEFQSTVKVPLDLLAERRGSRRSSATVSLKNIEQKVLAMEESLNARAFAKVVEIDMEIRQLKELLADPLEARDLVARGDKALALAKAHLEFEAMKFVVSGCVVYKGDASQSVAIINGKSYSPGELVADDLKVTAVTPSELVFDFRGVRMTRRHDGS